MDEKNHTVSDHQQVLTGEVDLLLLIIIVILFFIYIHLRRQRGEVVISSIPSNFISGLLNPPEWLLYVWVWLVCCQPVSSLGRPSCASSQSPGASIGRSGWHRCPAEPRGKPCWRCFLERQRGKNKNHHLMFRVCLIPPTVHITRLR